MTFLEKGKELMPTLPEHRIIFMCPQQLKLEKVSVCPASVRGEDRGCQFCWNRQMPNKKKGSK